jgi:deazaflavin-dependent oxidoreductase (nitroreductase family)
MNMASFIDRNGPVIEEFRANNGNVEGRKFPVLLLTTTGGKTGAKRVSPMAYQEGDNALYVFASRGGAPNHPYWYLNLVANPDVTVEVSDETYEATATSLEGEEHDRIYAKQATDFPQFGEYQEKTDRIIPVVALVKKASRPPFVRPSLDNAPR